MPSKLTPQQLNIHIDPQSLGFESTAELLQQVDAEAQQWIGQDRAFSAASFGLRMRQPGYHMLVVGEPGSGRTSLIRKMVQQELISHAVPYDLVYLLNFNLPERPLLLKLRAGKGREFRQLLEQFSRRLPNALKPASNRNVPSPDGLRSFNPQSVANAYLEQQLSAIRQQVAEDLIEPDVFDGWWEQLVQEVLDNLDAFAPAPNNENDDLQEAFAGRFRANLLVNNAGLTGAPVIYDDDPSYASLFGGIESSSDQQAIDFMRLKAGNLLRANGGALILHLEDLFTGEHGSCPLLEKLGRVLRNRKLQIEDAGSASGSGALNALSPEGVPLHFKLILIASRDDYHRLHEEHAALLEYFRIKVEFAESRAAEPAIYRQVACQIAKLSVESGLPHFTAAAVARLLQVLHEWEEDQARISLSLGKLQPLMHEAAALTPPGQLVDVAEIEEAIRASHSRHDYAEQQFRESIMDGELLVNLQGWAVGRINGLTHIDMGDAAFGSPVQISARCHPGRHGLINIDREVKLTGPQHDKGVFILQNWLAATFAQDAPLALNASLVFEQEYHGVEGDSASCAELFVLISSLSGLPLQQGIAVTGALNQYGDVLPVGGIKEKVEGYFRLCQQSGLDGKQGVLLPARNLRHVLLDNAVVEAAAAGKFHLYAMNNVLEGIAHLADMPAGQAGDDGVYPEDTVLGRAQRTLWHYQNIYQRNHQAGKVHE